MLVQHVQHAASLECVKHSAKKHKSKLAPHLFPLLGAVSLMKLL